MVLGERLGLTRILRWNTVECALAARSTASSATKLLAARRDGESRHQTSCKRFYSFSSSVSFVAHRLVRHEAVRRAPWRRITALPLHAAAPSHRGGRAALERPERSLADSPSWGNNRVCPGHIDPSPTKNTYPLPPIHPLPSIIVPALTPSLFNPTHPLLPSVPTLSRAPRAPRARHRSVSRRSSSGV